MRRQDRSVPAIFVFALVGGLHDLADLLRAMRALCHDG